MKTVFAETTEKLSLVGKVSDDKLKLFIDAERLTPVHVEANDLVELLSKYLNPEMLDQGVLRDVANKLSNGEKAEERRVAKGRAAEQGADGKLVLLVKKYTGEAEIKADSKGFVHYNELNLFDNISIDQVVARLYPPHDGVDGFNALGEKLPAKAGVAFKPKFDKTLQLAKSPNADDRFEILKSLKEGLLIEDSGALRISDELTINGDLDFRYGKEDFVGKIVLKGDAKPGFKLKAKKGIEVRGALTGANLECSEGDIELRGVSVGSAASSIICNGSVTVSVAEQLRIEAHGDIVVRKRAQDCELRSGQSIRMSEADLIGGQSFVVCGLEARDIGNAAGVETAIHLCGDIEASSEYAKLALTINSHQKAAELIKMHLGPLINNPARVANLKEPHRTKMKKMFAKLEQVTASMARLETKRLEMLSGQRSSNIVRVNYKRSLYSGAWIEAGSERLDMHETREGPAAILLDQASGKLIDAEFQALVCEFEGNKDGK
ncbi:MAG: DUF342 domain-containing protein [Bdellovibrionales bacterium]|nr:DUF342 domain-containing protein [Bdellovibrionales bacterium]